MASSWSCVTKIKVMPTSRCRDFSSTCIWRRRLASSAESGSSSSSTRGRLTRARASATRCCWPPLSLRGAACAKSAHLHHRERLRHAVREFQLWRCFLRAARKRRFRRPKDAEKSRSFGRRYSPGADARECVEPLAVHPDFAAIQLFESGDQAQQVVLPEPLSPRMVRNSPDATSSVIPRNTGRLPNRLITLRMESMRRRSR